MARPETDAEITARRAREAEEAAKRTELEAMRARKRAADEANEWYGKQHE